MNNLVRWIIFPVLYDRDNVFLISVNWIISIIQSNFPILGEGVTVYTYCIANSILLCQSLQYIITLSACVLYCLFIFILWAVCFNRKLVLNCSGYRVRLPSDSDQVVWVPSGRLLHCSCLHGTLPSLILWFIFLSYWLCYNLTSIKDGSIFICWFMF